MKVVEGFYYRCAYNIHSTLGEIQCLVFGQFVQMQKRESDLNSILSDALSCANILLL